MRVNIGKGLEFDVDPSKFSQPVLDHITYMGLRNVLMDSHANHTKETGDDYVERSRETAQRKLDSLYAGEVRAAGTRSSDPILTEAIKLATQKIVAHLRGKGIKTKDMDAKVIRTKAQELAPKFMETAKANVAAAKALEVEIEM